MATTSAIIHNNQDIQSTVIVHLIHNFESMNNKNVMADQHANKINKVSILRESHIYALCSYNKVQSLLNFQIRNLIVCQMCYSSLCWQIHIIE